MRALTRVKLLATGVNGNQTLQAFTVKYSDGSSTSFLQSLSDWPTPQNYIGESIAFPVFHRDLSSGSIDNHTFNLYGYSFALNSVKTVSSIQLPSNSNDEVSAITLVP